mmetsp:Transcript_139285/g.277737  ORF Transcript_139285/g.277737 Transcript_139285/m.277737 type:complete len:111 (+) Transcript_139285:192-524(+)|eukprot:CAMPEP_0172671318 /NCGR_PEP_ID=MMETSP1074-20121228/10843_1 /TAXON_ID=2916 /ORGANISM="Ceratium fusus, Strain PA161109" /LENGTH=110 /DNA_ID=CAMNT_0013488345 /DNA_START=127 /DNA_END=459 /DNA_ORIENTATION=+
MLPLRRMHSATCVWTHEAQHRNAQPVVARAGLDALRELCGHGHSRATPVGCVSQGRALKKNTRAAPERNKPGNVKPAKKIAVPAATRRNSGRDPAASARGAALSTARLCV